MTLKIVSAMAIVMLLWAFQHRPKQLKRLRKSKINSYNEVSPRPPATPPPGP